MALIASKGHLLKDTLSNHPLHNENIQLHSRGEPQLGAKYYYDFVFPIPIIFEGLLVRYV